MQLGSLPSTSVTSKESSSTEHPEHKCWAARGYDMTFISVWLGGRFFAKSSLARLELCTCCTLSHFAELVTESEIQNKGLSD